MDSLNHADLGLRGAPGDDEGKLGEGVDLVLRELNGKRLSIASQRPQDQSRTHRIKLLSSHDRARRRVLVDDAHRLGDGGSGGGVYEGGDSKVSVVRVDLIALSPLTVSGKHPRGNSSKLAFKDGTARLRTGRVVNLKKGRSGLRKNSRSFGCRTDSDESEEAKAIFEIVAVHSSELGLARRGLEPSGQAKNTETLSSKSVHPIDDLSTSILIEFDLVVAETNERAAVEDALDGTLHEDDEIGVWL